MADCTTDCCTHLQWKKSGRKKTARSQLYERRQVHYCDVLEVTCALFDYQLYVNCHTHTIQSIYGAPYQVLVFGSHYLQISETGSSRYGCSRVPPLLGNTDFDLGD